MRRLIGLGGFFAVTALSMAMLSGASAAAASQVTVRLTGLNRAGQVVAVPQAELIPLGGFPVLYQGSPVRVDRGTYVIAAEVPTYAAGDTVTSQTLVVREVSIHSSKTVRLDAEHGKRLTVALTGATASNLYLAAGVCLASAPDGEGQVVQAASGGDGVTVYAVPVKSDYVDFSYLSISQSEDGATYYLTGSARNRIPSKLSYSQRAAALAKMTMVLRGGAFGTSMTDWSLQTGGSSSLCGTGQNQQATQPESWVNYLTPGTWTATAKAYSQDAGGNLHADSYFSSSRDYRSGHSYSNAFGGAVVGPVADYPSFAAAGDQFEYNPELFGSPGLNGGSICCQRISGTLRVGGHVVKRMTHSSCGTCFETTLHQHGWYTLSATATRSYQGGNTPADLLSQKVAVSFRFHTPPGPAGNGSWEYVPVTDTEYQALGLSLENQAPPGGTTKLVISISRPGNEGVAPPVYRIKSVTVYASLNGGTTWQRLALKADGSSWLATVPDPASGYVAIRSVVKDVHGDSTEQTVYRAYAVS